MKSSKRIDIISCPKCGAEYLAREIYIPDAFFGKDTDIEKDYTTHRILHDLGRPLNLNESYICDYCNTPFIVKAYIRFNVEEDTRHNFNKPYVTSLKKNSLFLSED